MWTVHYLIHQGQNPEMKEPVLKYKRCQQSYFEAYFWGLKEKSVKISQSVNVYGVIMELSIVKWTNTVMSITVLTCGTQLVIVLVVKLLKYCTFACDLVSCRM